eukprot:TRINITY_DN803_c0_g1_i1.p1 TRINITY_DN803_c0_g1~~TRINITY_DN803_c0_g1_i1.p1  ORF type:complete len:396 (-),score=114.55 TRINITY_DN803_c0_g1_i1:66-1253(-)
MADINAGASPKDVETFIQENKHELLGDALEIFQKMTPQDQRRVIADGGLRDCKNVVAVIKGRARKAREMEQFLAGGKLPGLPVAAPSAPQMPSLFTEEQSVELAKAYMSGTFTEVDPSERRLGTAAGGATPAASAGAEDEPLEGTVCGVGGVVEVIKAKYGCGGGQRLKVIGQTATIWQCEGGKTVPKAHNNSGWRWVMRGEAAEKKAAAAAATQAAKDAEKKKKAAAEAAATAKAAEEKAQREKEKEKERAREREKENEKRKEDNENGKDAESSKEAEKDKEKAEDKDTGKTKEAERAKGKEKEKDRSGASAKKRDRSGSAASGDDSRSRRGKRRRSRSRSGGARKRRRGASSRSESSGRKKRSRGKASATDKRRKGKTTSRGRRRGGSSSRSA